VNRGIDPCDIRAQEDAACEAREREALAAQVAEEDVKWLMSSKRGRRIVWQLLDTTGVFRLSYTGTVETYFREGARNVGLALLAQIHDACPGSYATMVKEQKA